MCQDQDGQKKKKEEKVENTGIPQLIHYLGKEGPSQNEEMMQKTDVLSAYLKLKILKKLFIRRGHENLI